MDYLQKCSSENIRFYHRNYHYRISLQVIIIEISLQENISLSQKKSSECINGLSSETGFYKVNEIGERNGEEILKMVEIKVKGVRRIKAGKFGNRKQQKRKTEKIKKKTGKIHNTKNERI